MANRLTFLGSPVAPLGAIPSGWHFAGLHMKGMPAETTVDPYGSADMWFGHKWGYFRMFLGVACRAQHFNIVTVHGARTIYAAGNLVVSIQIFSATAALAVTDFLYGALCQIVFRSGSLGSTSFPAWVFFFGRPRKCSRALSRAKAKLIPSMLPPLESDAALRASRLLHSATAPKLRNVHTRERTGGGFASQMRSWARIVLPAHVANQVYSHG
jgi:hypothetical protein